MTEAMMDTRGNILFCGSSLDRFQLPEERISEYYEMRVRILDVLTENVGDFVYDQGDEDVVIRCVGGVTARGALTN